jgi:hypothetical protein
VGFHSTGKPGQQQAPGSQRRWRDRRTSACSQKKRERKGVRNPIAHCRHPGGWYHRPLMIRLRTFHRAIRAVTRSEIRSLTGNREVGVQLTAHLLFLAGHTERRCNGLIQALFGKQLSSRPCKRKTSSD